MGTLNTELERNKPARYLKKITDCIKVDPIYITIMGRNRTAAFLLAQIIYWINCYLAQGKKEFYNSDKEFAAQIRCRCLKTFQRAKRKLIKLGIISVTVRFKGHKRVTYYELCEERLNALIEEAKNPSPSIALNPPQKTDENSKILKGHLPSQSVGLLPSLSVLLLHYQRTKCPFTLDKVSFSYIDTKTTTKINKINTSYFQKNNLLSNQSELGNLSYEQIPMSVETNLACSKEIIPNQSPALETEQSIQEGKAVGTFSNFPLIAEAVEAPQEFKATKKATKVKSEKVIKTKIDRNLELTPERRQIGLNARFLNRGLVEGVIETEFESFIDYFTETGTLRSDWDLSWKNWCKKAIELDKYNRKTIENPIRSGMTVSAPNEEKVSIDSAFAGFVKEKLNGMQFEFEGATYAEIDGKIVIDQQNSFRRELIEKLKDRLQNYFGKEIELKWLRNSWASPTVSKQEKEIVTPEVTEIETTKIMTSDVSILSPVYSPLCVDEIPLETSPVFETKALPKEPFDKSGIGVSANYVKLAIQKRLAAARGYQIDSNSLCEEKNNSNLTEEKNNQETVENVSNENQFCPSEHASESNPVMISVSGEAILATDQLQPNEDLQQNRSEISITQLCLEFPKAISAKPVEEEIQLEVREEINNLPPSRISNPTSAIINSPIKLSKPKSALHLPKFPVTAAKSFLDFPSTAKRLSDYAEMIRVNLINTNLKKEMPPGLSKPPQKSSILERCDIIPAEMVNATQAVKNNQLGLR